MCNLYLLSRRFELKEHLQRCPASTVECGFVWNRFIIQGVSLNMIIRIQLYEVVFYLNFKVTKSKLVRNYAFFYVIVNSYLLISKTKCVHNTLEPAS